jgi:NAD(P)-dependent dehydrogenase (short-subunit alcohol dehydrogenase family)
MVDRLTDKVAIITGGAGGIGEATTRLFMEEGAFVTIVDHDEHAVAASFERLDVTGFRVLPLVADLTDENECARVVRQTISKYRRVDILVNVAAIREYGPITEATPESWQRIIGVNLLASAYMCKFAIPAMAEAGGGSIVNISSANAVVGRKGMAQYDATKAALLGLTRALACDHAEQKIRVNTVCPGFTVTSYHINRLAEAEGMSPEAAAATLRDQPYSLVGHPASPRDIAQSILYLASDESSFVTGATFMIDGGLSV